MTTEITTISANDSGVLIPRTIEDSYRLAKFYVVSGLLPERYKTPESVMTAMQFALELGLKPLSALRQIAVVKGTPCMFGDLPLSLVRASNLSEYFFEYYLDQNGKRISVANGNATATVFAAVTVSKRKGEAEESESIFTLDDARTAGLLNSPTWKSYPKRMLRYRARSALLKDLYPDALNGIAIGEYDHNTIIEDVESKVISVRNIDADTPAFPAQKGSLTERLQNVVKPSTTEEVIDGTAASTIDATHAPVPDFE